MILSKLLDNRKKKDLNSELKNFSLKITIFLTNNLFAEFNLT